MIKPIGLISTCYKEKFGIPRQAGLVPSSYGVIELIAPYNKEEALRGLETFSHLIITFIPHANPEKSSLTVRPPRLGGNKRLGVFATRSPHRPNPICSSIVELKKIDEAGSIYIANHDILDQSPLLDLKPYIPRWDCYPQATEGWLTQYPEDDELKVIISNKFALNQQDKSLILEVLKLNPTPRYEKSKKEFALKLAKYDVHFRFLDENTIEVYKLTDLV